MGKGEEILLIISDPESESEFTSREGEGKRVQRAQMIKLKYKA